jgi:hypothetical protein
MTLERAGATVLAYGLLLPAVSASLARVPVTAAFHLVSRRVSGNDERLDPGHLTAEQLALFLRGGRAA